MLKQLNLSGKNMIDVAIERIKMYETEEGYELGFSGGKDSIVIYDLAKKAGVKFVAVYKNPSIDPPELVHFIRDNYPEVIRLPPPITMWELIKQKHMFPRPKTRFCCNYLKEYDSGTGKRFIITGVRWAESRKRKERRLVEHYKRRVYLHPIIDWSDADVWEYIRSEKLKYCRLYDEGYHRIGCILCPMMTVGNKKRDERRYPKIANQWKRMADYLYSIGGMPENKSGEHYYNTWVNNEILDEDKTECLLVFED